MWAEGQLWCLVQKDGDDRPAAPGLEKEFVNAGFSGVFMFDLLTCTDLAHHIGGSWSRGPSGNAPEFSC